MTTDNYIEILIPAADEDTRAMLIAGLEEIGYDGFEETGTALKAYIPEVDFAQNELDILLQQYSIKYSKSIISKQNWNQLWESNFEPVQVDDFVGIRANFHPCMRGVEHEIVITPKMSFGTGHHATTWLVMQLMRDIVFTGKTVFDFGTGTGILAILAEKLGASRVLAVDNDDWCIENASENTLINNCNRIDIQKVDTADTADLFDIVIANINRHIILENIHFLDRSLSNGGTMVLSGLLIHDEKELLELCKGLGWQYVKTVNKNGWIAMVYTKKS